MCTVALFCDFRDLQTQPPPTYRIPSIPTPCSWVHSPLCNKIQSHSKLKVENMENIELPFFLFEYYALSMWKLYEYAHYFIIPPTIIQREREHYKGITLHTILPHITLQAPLFLFGTIQRLSHCKCHNIYKYVSNISY